MDYTRKIAEFAVQTRYEEIPPKALEAAKNAMIDCVGVALAGSRELPSRLCARLAQEEKAKGKATLFGHGFKSSPITAAFVNGTSAHALDYDHSFTLMGQPTAGLIPAIFAVGEALGRSGREVLASYVVGFEVTTKLAWSAPSLSSQGGWHSTGILGSLGAAAGSAKLLRLDAQGVQMALGIATSMASGVVWNFGTMTKPLHAGLAARNGVLAAKLAHEGFTGNPLILDGPKGFFESFARNLPYDLTPLSGLGTAFELAQRGVKFKAYPCGGLTHTAIDAVLELRQEHDLTHEIIRSIKVGVTPYTHDRIIYRIPETGLQGKFSMPYILARAVIDGKLTVETFSDEAVRDPVVLSFAEKVSMEIEPELEERLDGSHPCKVWIQLKDGRTLSREKEFPKGTPEFPLSPEEIREKFTQCARRVVDGKTASRALGLLERLERLKSLKSLCRLLAFPRDV